MRATEHCHIVTNAQMLNDEPIIKCAASNRKDYSYLLDGTVRQQAAYRALEALRVFSLLSPFDPVLAGTIPLDIDIPGSDLDVVCEATDVDVFAEYLCDRFGQCTGFSVRQKVMHGLPTVIAQFTAQGFPVEIFGQPLPVMAQAAVRHMVVEERLLRHGGPEVCHKIRQLKGQGLKTEPAFAAVFGLPGDPYQTLLAFAELSEDVLISALTPTLRTHQSGEMSF
jgi:Domain of unknown function (DUF4269)